MNESIKPLTQGEISFADPDLSKFVSSSGLAGREPIGRWSNGENCSLAFRLPSYIGDHVLLKLDVAPFIFGSDLSEQTADIVINGVPATRWRIFDRLVRRRVLLIKRDLIPSSREITIELTIPTCAQPSALGLNTDQRYLGLNFQRLAWEAISEIPPEDSLIWQYGRPVGGESRKTFDRKIESGFWSRFIGGRKILDIGFRGYQGDSVVPIIPDAIGVDLDYPGYDGRTLPFGPNSQDVVYSSHCLEHISDYVNAIQDWHRVIRPGGHIITVVPCAYLYERKMRPPSRHNNTHRRFYTPSSLLHEFEQALLPNSYRVRHLAENDFGYSYADAATLHPRGCYEIELVIEKIEGPVWNVEC